MHDAKTLWDELAKNHPDWDAAKIANTLVLILASGYPVKKDDDEKD